VISWQTILSLWLRSYSLHDLLSWPWLLCVVRVCAAREAATSNRANIGVPGKKNPNRERLGFQIMVAGTIEYIKQVIVK